MKENIDDQEELIIDSFEVEDRLRFTFNTLWLPKHTYWFLIPCRDDKTCYLSLQL
jgi:hypothetical protein